MKPSERKVLSTGRKSVFVFPPDAKQNEKDSAQPRQQEAPQETKKQSFLSFAHLNVHDFRALGFMKKL